MTGSILDAVAQARDNVPAIAPEDAANLLGRDDVLFVDVRDADEIARSGKIAGALNVSRGMLEFRADPQTPLYHTAFDRSKTIVLYCGTGARAALCGQALLNLGYSAVRNLGAFATWEAEDLPTE